jgi:putative hydrolase of HD superfamily
MEFTELDKQAHKMIIAYVLGKYEEKTKNINWIEIIEGGIFELLQRIELTDIKPSIFWEIKKKPHEYQQLNEWVHDQLYPAISPLGKDFRSKFRDYFRVKNENSNINRKILNAAHILATDWEYEIIYKMNDKDMEREEIRNNISKELSQYVDLEGVKRIKGGRRYNIKTFVNLCGYLRFQSRWSHVRRITQTSVLGHMLIVAILTYLYSIQERCCYKRCFNNYFTGLFHDFAEILTRDIISPVKIRIPEGIIEEYQRYEMERKVYKYIPKEWVKEITLFTEDEFIDFITKNDRRIKVPSIEINKRYNKDKFIARDGRWVKACDDLAAFTEAYLALRHGVTFQILHDAKYILRNKYNRKGNRNIAGINFAQLYADYDE